MKGIVYWAVAAGFGMGGGRIGLLLCQRLGFMGVPIAPMAFGGLFGLGSARLGMKLFMGAERALREARGR